LFFFQTQAIRQPREAGFAHAKVASKAVLYSYSKDSVNITSNIFPSASSNRPRAAVRVGMVCESDEINR